MKKHPHTLLLKLLWATSLALCAGLAFLMPGRLPARSSHLPDSLSPKAELSVLTCAPGTELYSIFGHSSIRVHDPAQRIDWVFNYGTFEFSKNGFALKFARGKLRYYLLSYSMDGFMEEYQEDQRSVREQVLNLDHAAKLAIFRALKVNELPENKFYAYDFFFDNCASRERDILRNTLGERLRLQAPASKEYGSYRSLIHPYMGGIPWTAFGIDIALGSPTDATAGTEGAVFLPDHLHDVLGASQVQQGDKWLPLVKEDRNLFQATVKPEEPGFVSPWVVMWAIAAFGAAISFLPFGQARVFHLYDTLLFGVIGLLGVLLVLFWTATNHQATYANLNLIWALPTHLFFAVGVWVPKWRGAVSRYAKYAGVLLVLFLLSNWFLPQAFPAAVYPLVAIMAARFYVFWLRGQD